MKRSTEDLYGDIRRGENAPKETGGQRRRAKHVSDGAANQEVAVALRLENKQT